MATQARTRLLLALAVLVLALTGVPVSADAEQGRDQRSRLAFDHVDPVDPDNQSVLTVDPFGHAEHLVVSGTCCPGWSPDGRRLAVPRAVEGERIGTAVVDADGSHYRALPLEDATLNIGCGTGSWSPGGSRLACETWDDVHPARDGVYTISARTGGHLRRVTTNPFGGHDIPGAYSPDGSRIVFVRFRADGISAGIFTVRANGRDLEQVVATNTILNIGVDWSPRDNRILFSQHRTQDSLGSLWTVRDDGTHIRELRVRGRPCGGLATDPKATGCHGPRWSPDGHQVVFASAGNIYTIHASGSHLRQVTRRGGSDDPDWGGPDEAKQ